MYVGEKLPWHPPRQLPTMLRQLSSLPRMINAACSMWCTVLAILTRPSSQDSCHFSFIVLAFFLMHDFNTLLASQSFGINPPFLNPLLVELNVGNPDLCNLGFEIVNPQHILSIDLCYCYVMTLLACQPFGRNPGFLMLVTLIGAIWDNRL